MSKDATRIYSTWFSVVPRGYCDLGFLGERTSWLERRGADPDPESDEEWDDTPTEEVLSLELGFDVRSVSGTGGTGDRGGRGW